MSLYRVSFSTIGRGNSGEATTRSAVAAASYIAREPLYDELQGVMRELTVDASDLIRSEILLPEHAPSRWLDRATLWNEVEAGERQWNAQVARAFTLTLPRELPLDLNVDLARDFTARAFVSQGMVADLGVHSKQASDGLPQPHAHGLLTMRRIVDGAFGLKERAWNTAAKLVEWRATWAAMANRALERAGLSQRIDHRRAERPWQRTVVQVLASIPSAVSQAASAAPKAENRALKTAQEERVRHKKKAPPLKGGASFRASLPSPRPIAPKVRTKIVVNEVLAHLAGKEMRPMSESEAVDQFRQAMVERGLRPSGDPIMDGKFHRVPVEGDRKGQRSGSYLGYLDGRPAGFIQNFKSGEPPTRWKADGGSYVVPDPAALAEARAAREAKRAAEVAATADTAARMWNTAASAREHPYLERKGITAPDLRVTARGDLLVPLRDPNGRLWNVQRITHDGEKLFLRGGRVTGTHTLVGELTPNGPLVIVEGYATARTVHEATGLPVAAAINAGNLEAVARAYRERNPGRTIVIASDNDHNLPLRNPPLPNVGIEKAQAAANAVGGRVMTPTFGLGDNGTDWNDFARMHGNGAVRGAFEREGIAMGEKRDEVIAEERRATQAQRDLARQSVPALAQAVLTADVQAQQASRRAQEAAMRSHELTR